MCCPLSTWCRLLSGRADLPPQAEQEASVAQHYQWLQEVGRPLRYCHMMDAVRVYLVMFVGGRLETGRKCVRGTESLGQRLPCHGVQGLPPGLLAKFC